MRANYLAAAAAVIGCSSAPAQSNLADRILGVRDGAVRMTYAVREGICGDGVSFIRDRSRGQDNYTTYNDGESHYRNRSWRDLYCEPGPARIAFTLIEGSVAKIRLYVGGAWGTAGSGASVTDLGTVSAPLAAKAFIRIASREHQAKGAIFAAMIADSSIVWPELLALAKSDAPKAIRKDAVFWLSQAAAAEATKGLTDLVDDTAEDRDIREQAVFAISQRPAEQSVPVLIRLVKTNRDPQIRRKAMFWLGQSDDPRALKLIEEILLKG